MESIKKYRILILRIFITIVLIGNCVIIFNYSGQNAKKSADISTGTMYKIIKVVTGNNDYEKAKQLDPLIRKLAHFFVYMSLGIWSGCLLCTFFSNADENKRDIRRINIAILFGFLYACSDEIHQMFVDGRAGRIIDVTIDTLGVAIGVLIIIIVLKIIENKKVE